MPPSQFALSFVEEGWRAARTLSIVLVRELQFDVTHYVKGHVDSTVLQMITPYPYLRIIAVRRNWFKMVRLVVLVWGLLRRHWRLVIVDNAKTYRLVKRFANLWGIAVIEARERHQQLLYHINGKALDVPTLVQGLRADMYHANSAFL